MIPFELVIWDAEECAAYLKEARTYFLQHTRHKEGFPPEIPGKPKRWRALSVTQWALGVLTHNGIATSRSAPSIFNLTAGTISTRFRELCKEVGIKGLSFHCLRRTAATRLSKKLDVWQLCSMFGWHDPKIPMKHYYKSDTAEIARRLD